MRYPGRALAVAVVCCVLLGSAGCASGPAGKLTGFLDALRNGQEQEASSACYDKQSFRDVSGALAGQLNGATVKVLSVEEPGSGRVREKGYAPRSVATVEERMEKPLAEIEARFKPLIEYANAVLANAQAEYNNAVEMKKYAAMTYGTNMPQYRTEQSRINNALPRLHGAQARVDELTAARDAEVADLKAGAEAGYKQEKGEASRALARNSVEMPTLEMTVDLVQGSSSERRVFTLVEDVTWKVYSVAKGG